MKIKDLLISKKHSKKIAIISDNNRITYQSWYEKSSELSNRINNYIKQESLYIGILLPNSVEYAIAYFGITFSNKIIVPIEINSSDTEIKSLCKYCEIDLIISDSNHIKQFENILKNYMYSISIYLIDKDEFLTNKAEKINKSSYLLSNNEVAILLHTSGTTSNPKRVMLTHKNLISNVEANINNLNLSRDEKTLITLPMYFGYCNTTQILTSVYLGAEIVILNGIFTPKKFFETIENEKITNTTAVPTTLLMLLSYRYYNKYNIKSLKTLCFGGGKISNETLVELYKKYPTIGFVQTYGQTECSPRVTSLLSKDSKKKVGSVGTELPGVTVKIVNKKNNEVKANTIGEIIVNGPNTMKGYFKNDQATKAVLKDNWIFTGDLGYKDNDGYLYLVGRKKNIIISGGINIYPEEIEEILVEQNDVIDAIVYGEYDKWLGEIPVANIVVSENADINLIKNNLSQKLPNHKIPKSITIVKSIEKTHTGKNKRQKHKGE